MQPVRRSPSRRHAKGDSNRVILQCDEAASTHAHRQEHLHGCLSSRVLLIFRAVLPRERREQQSQKQTYREQSLHLRQQARRPPAAYVERYSAGDIRRNDVDIIFHLFLFF